MNRNLLKLAVIAAAVSLAACSTTKTADAEADAKQVASAQAVEKALPDWFLEVPKSSSAYKSVGDGVSGSVSGALGNARANAFEGICQAAGGKVRSQTKVFRQDTESDSKSISTTAIRNFCPDVDVSGATVEKQQVIRDGSRFRAFVLVSLDKGASTTKEVSATADKAFKELDDLNAKQ